MNEWICLRFTRDTVPLIEKHQYWFNPHHHRQPRPPRHPRQPRYPRHPRHTHQAHPASTPSTPNTPCTPCTPSTAHPAHPAHPHPRHAHHIQHIHRFVFTLSDSYGQWPVKLLGRGYFLLRVEDLSHAHHDHCWICEGETFSLTR